MSPHERANQSARIQELKKRVESLVGREMDDFSMKECSPDDEEQFWRNLLRVETTPDTTLRVRLMRSGVKLIPSAELLDQQLQRKLWEIIHTLAAQKVYLARTNHLSDRQLYKHLIDELLDLKVKDFAPGDEWDHVIELLDATTAEGAGLLARYYADEFDYELLQEEWPDLKLPPPETPPFDRDARLPRP